METKCPKQPECLPGEENVQQNLENSLTHPSNFNVAFCYHMWQVLYSGNTPVCRPYLPLNTHESCNMMKLVPPAFTSTYKPNVSIRDCVYDIITGTRGCEISV